MTIILIFAMLNLMGVIFDGVVWGGGGGGGGVSYDLGMAGGCGQCPGTGFQKSWSLCIHM